jgi:hypothetical protein
MDARIKSGHDDIDDVAELGGGTEWIAGSSPAMTTDEGFAHSSFCRAGA